MFNPDKYLAEKGGGFNPDAYLAEKTKQGTSQPQEESPKFYEIEKQPGMELPERGQGFLKDTANLAKHAAGQYFEQIKSPMPFSTIKAPITIAQENASRFGADVARAADDFGLHTGIARTAGFVASGAADPLTWGEGLVTKLLGRKVPVPKAPQIGELLNRVVTKNEAAKQAVESQTARVMDTLDNVVQKSGDELNAAKKSLGLPVTNAEREASIASEGNPYGFNTSNPAVKPYLKYIEPEKDPEKLVTQVSEFKKVMKSIPEKVRVQLAQILQDKINTIVDWTKSGTGTEGVLKSQYRELKQLALPEGLKGAKESMAAALDLGDDLGSKIKEPGQAEAFLRNMITGKSARTKDSIKLIQRLEDLSGQKILDSIRNAVLTDKATEFAIKHLKKAAAANAEHDLGVTVWDLIKLKTHSWLGVAKMIVSASKEVKDAIKSAAKSTAKGVASAPALGFAKMGEGQNKTELENVLQKIKGTGMVHFKDSKYGKH